MSTIPIPSTPAGTQFAAWLTAFNSASGPTLRAWYSQAFPHPISTQNPNSSTNENDNDNDNIAHELAFRSRTGGFEVQQIVTSEPTKISVMLNQKNTEKKSKVTLEIEAGETYLRRFVIVALGDGEETGEEVPVATILKSVD